MIWKGWWNFHLGQLIFVSDWGFFWLDVFSFFFYQCGWAFHSSVSQVTPKAESQKQTNETSHFRLCWGFDSPRLTTIQSIWGRMMVANVMGNFRFFREELAGSIPWGCILGEQWSSSARSMEIERNWPDPMEENRPENWEVSFMPSFLFDEFGLWLSAKSWKRSTTKMQLLGPTPKEVWGSTIWRFSNNWMIGIVQMVTNFE